MSMPRPGCAAIGSGTASYYVHAVSIHHGAVLGGVTHGGRGVAVECEHVDHRVDGGVPPGGGDGRVGEEEG